MSKNLTRKGIAFGAMFALATSAFAGAPAQAAPGTGQLLLAPSSGTEWIIPSTNIFSVKVNYVAGNTNAQAAKLKLKITTPGGFRVNTDAANTTLATAITGVTDSTVAANVTSGDLALGADNVFAGLAIDSGSAATTYNVGVQAWEDSDLDGVIDTGEWTSNSETIAFTKNADITWTTVVDNVAVGVTSATAKITSNANISQLAWGTGTDATTNGTNGVVRFEDDTTSAGTFAQTASAAAPVRVTYNSTDNRLEATSGTLAAATVAADKVRASFYFVNAKNRIGAFADAGELTQLIGGTGSYAAPTAGLAAVSTFTATVDAQTISAVGTATVTASAATVQSSTNAKVLTGTTSITVKSKVTAVSGASKSGVAVKFVFAENANASLAAAGTVTSGTTVLQNTNAGVTQSKDVTATTDADGNATVTFTLAGLVAANAFIVTPSSQGITTTGTTITVEDETIGSIVNIDAIGGITAVEEIVVPTKANFDLKFAVLNQFGKAITGSAYSVSASQSTTTVVGSVVNGVATVNFPKFDTATSVTIAAQGKKNGVNAGSAINVEVTVGTASVPANLTFAGSGSGTGSRADFGAVTALGLNTEAAFVAADTRKGDTAAAITANEFSLVSGTVTTSTGAPALTTVTLSGAGLDFIADGVYAKETITVTTSDAGAYNVQVLSNKAGSKTLTIKSGTVTKTQVIKFAEAADTAGKTLTITSSATVVKPGRTVKFAGKLVDAFGNGVAVTNAAGTKTFTVTYDGPGFVQTMPTSTAADGSFTVSVLMGTGDSGPATLSATYDGDATGSTYAAVTASKQILVGVSSSAVAGSKRANVTVKGAFGATVKVVSGSRTVTKVATSDNFRVSLTKLAAGKRTVKVYVNDMLVRSQSVTVRR